MYRIITLIKQKPIVALKLLNSFKNILGLEAQMPNNINASMPIRSLSCDVSAPFTDISGSLRAVFEPIGDWSNHKSLILPLSLQQQAYCSPESRCNRLSAPHGIL